MFPEFDIPGILTLLLLSVACALCGAVLVLRRQSMAVDAMTHSVLLGIVISFLILGEISIFGSTVAAAMSCVAVLWGIEVFSRSSHITRESSTGIMMVTFFAGGIALVSAAVDSRVHLDTDAALFGALEHVYWPGAVSLEALLDLETWNSVPRQIVSAAIATLAAVLFVVVPFRRLSIHLFDREFAESSGIWRKIDSVLLTVGITLAVVGAFEAVGAVLAVALFCAPTCISFTMARSFQGLLLVSALTGVIGSLSGYAVTIAMPLMFEGGPELAAGGTGAVLLGLAAVIAIALGSGRNRAATVVP